MIFRIGVVFAAVALASCGAREADLPDSGNFEPDARIIADDAGSSDAGATMDAGTPDARLIDAGTIDAGATDAGHQDAGMADAGSPYTFQVSCRVGFDYFVIAQYRNDGGSDFATNLYGERSDGGVQPISVAWNSTSGHYDTSIHVGFGYVDVFTFEVGPWPKDAGQPPTPLVTPFYHQSISAASVTCQ